jgi:Tfp pilus assembly protein PilF
MGLEALSRLPDDPAIHFNLANTLGKEGHYEEAEETFKKAISLKPNQALYHTNLGKIFYSC